MKELAKKKARELVDKFTIYLGTDAVGEEYYASQLDAKRCALIAVDYLIAEQEIWQNGEPNPVLFWQEVKKEIEQL